jgi:hypothetical protein
MVATGAVGDLCDMDVDIYHDAAIAAVAPALHLIS